MTTVVGFVSRSVVQVAADRLVSVSRSGRHTTHDPDSNKLVVFLARDSFAIFGYSGLAYLGGRPTDEAMAQALANTELGPPMAMVLRTSPLALDLASATRRVREMLGRASAKLGPSVAPVVLVAGWHARKRDRGRHEEIHGFMWRLHRAAAGEPYQLTRIPTLPDRLQVHGIPDGRLTRHDVDKYFDRVEASKHEVSETEVGLVDLVRHVASRSEARGDPTVGRDVMVLTIEVPTSHQPIRIKYDTEKPSTSKWGSFTPWIVAPNHIWPPAEASPMFGIQLAGVSFKLIGPQYAPKRGGIAAQKRRGPPR